MNLEKPVGYEKEQVAMRVEKLNNEMIQAITTTVSGFEIEETSSDDGTAPKGYYQFRVSIDNGTDITGTPFQSAVNALQDFLDYATDVVRSAAELDQL